MNQPSDPTPVTNSQPLTNRLWTPSLSILANKHWWSYCPWIYNLPGAVCRAEVWCKEWATVSVENRVSIALWKLVTPDCYCSVANQLGMQKFTFGAALLQMCRAINHIAQCRTDMGNCGWQWQKWACQTGGAINSAHIPMIVLPTLSQSTSSGKDTSWLMDHRRHFTDINAGWSGKVDDACVFRNNKWPVQKAAGRNFSFQTSKLQWGDVEKMYIVNLCDWLIPFRPY